MADSAADGMVGAGVTIQTQDSQQHQQVPTLRAQQEVDRIVLNYLNQKGYTEAALALKCEANLLLLPEDRPQHHQRPCTQTMQSQIQQEVDRIVLKYVYEKGYRETELALEREAGLLAAF